MQPQTGEHRGKRACALTARGSISKATKGLVGGAAQGSGRLSKELDHSPDPAELGLRNHPTRAECTEAARGAWGGGRYKAARSAMREQERSRNRYRVAPACQTATLGGSRVPQVNVKNIWTPSSPSQRHRLFQGLDIFTIKWALGI